MRVVIFFLTALFAFNCAFAEDRECSPERSLRRVIGPETVTTELRRSAEDTTDVFFNKGEFDEERFSYVGRIKLPSGKSWHVVLLETIWGCSHRSTPRLLIFSSENRYIGQYSHFTGRRPRIEGDAIVFDDIAADVGNKISFADTGPPPQIWLDGENPQFYK